MKRSQRFSLYAGLGFVTVGLLYKLWKRKGEKKVGLKYCVLLGDVGGTNVRLSEVTFRVQGGGRTEQGPIAKPVIYQSQEAKSIEEAIEKYLKVRSFTSRSQPLTTLYPFRIAQLHHQLCVS
jgi:hypothetical protein